jgi:hypothetical protein
MSPVDHFKIQYQTWNRLSTKSNNAFNKITTESVDRSYQKTKERLDVPTCRKREITAVGNKIPQA